MELQRALPNARIIYASATGATGNFKIDFLEIFRIFVSRKDEEIFELN